MCDTYSARAGTRAINSATGCVGFAVVRYMAFHFIFVFMFVILRCAAYDKVSFDVNRL